MFTRFVPAAFRVPGVEPSPSTEKLWSRLSATDAFDSAARGAPMSGRPSRPSSTAEGHGATVTQFFTRRPMTSIFCTTSRPARPDVSKGTSRRPMGPPRPLGGKPFPFTQLLIDNGFVEKEAYDGCAREEEGTEGKCCEID